MSETSYYKRLRRRNNLRRFISRRKKYGHRKKSKLPILLIIVILIVAVSAVIRMSESNRSVDSEQSPGATTAEGNKNISSDMEQDNSSDDSKTLISETSSTDLKNDTGKDPYTPEELMDELAPTSKGLVESDPAQIPDYSGEDYIVLNYNQPMFTEYELSHFVGEQFSELDSLGRCGSAMAMIDRSMMPTEERGSIGMIKPSGWHTVKYPDVISDLYLYNRCHLIGYALTGENDNVLNLITGTRYMNVSIMLIFEREAIRILEDTDLHVLYRATPLFVGDELVARGVELEAFSVEDQGNSLCFHVFCYNIQPGITIDYLTGDSREN